MDELVKYMRSINPQKDEQAILIYGSKYKLWLDGKYIGTAFWTEDEYIGDSFQNLTGDNEVEVSTPDKWELIVSK